jgi:hypothetical protein
MNMQKPTTCRTRPRAVISCDALHCAAHISRRFASPPLLVTLRAAIRPGKRSIRGASELRSPGNYLGNPERWLIVFVSQAWNFQPYTTVPPTTFPRQTTSAEMKEKSLYA